MKIGFICPNLPGHINPMTALARHLQARNLRWNSQIQFIRFIVAHKMLAPPIILAMLVLLLFIKHAEKRPLAFSLL